MIFGRVPVEQTQVYAHAALAPGVDLEGRLMQLYHCDEV